MARPSREVNRRLTRAAVHATLNVALAFSGGVMHENAHILVRYIDAPSQILSKSKVCGRLIG